MMIVLVKVVLGFAFPLLLIAQMGNKFILWEEVIAVGFLSVVTVSDAHQDFKVVEVGLSLNSCFTSTGNSGHFLMYPTGFLIKDLN